jgi:hypothetical protein
VTAGCVHLRAEGNLLVSIRRPKMTASFTFGQLELERDVETDLGIN